MSLFNHSFTFQPVDPMADGLGDDIRREQREDGHFELEEQLDMTLAEKWGELLADPENDPESAFITN